MFQPAPAPRFPARFLAASIVIHAAGIVLLLVLGFTGPPAAFPTASLQNSLRVALVGPAPYRAEPAPRPVQRPEQRKFRPPPRVFQPGAKPAPVAFLPALPPPAPRLAEVPREIPRTAVPTPPILPVPIQTGTFSEAQAPAPAATPQTGIKAAGFDTDAAAHGAAPLAAHVRASGFTEAIGALPGASPKTAARASGFSEALGPGVASRLQSGPRSWQASEMPLWPRERRPLAQPPLPRAPRRLKFSTNRARLIPRKRGVSRWRAKS